MKARLRTILRFTPCLGIVCAALLWPSGCIGAENVTMALDDLGHGTYRLEGHFPVQGSPYDVWRVLTDYEHISQFVKSLRKSTIKESSTDRLLLDQEALGKEFVFSKRIRVVLQVTEIPYKKLLFEDVAHDDFAFYEGSWNIETSSTGVNVVYRLNCQRSFMVPNSIAKDALRKAAADLLEQVRAEVLRRQQGGQTPCPCGQS